MALYEPVLAELNETGVRYVVVGGLAVLLHGYLRATGDVDIVVDLSSDSGAARFVDALVLLGLRPQVPVNPRDFGDRRVREGWVRDKGMKVLSMVDPGDPFRTVDLFVEEPVPFEELFSRSHLVRLRSASVRVASIPDLVLMKRRAGRPQDLLDIEALEAIEARRRDG